MIFTIYYIYIIVYDKLVKSNWGYIDLIKTIYTYLYVHIVAFIFNLIQYMSIILKYI